MQTIEYADKLDELTVGTVIVNRAHAGALTYFVQGENGNWWPCSPTGRLLPAVTTYVPDGGFRSGRIYLPAQVVDVADAVRDEAHRIVHDGIEMFFDADITRIASSVVDQLVEAGLLRGAR